MRVLTALLQPHHWPYPNGMHQCYWTVKRCGYLVLLDNLQAQPTSLLFDIFVQVVSMIC